MQLGITKWMLCYVECCTSGWLVASESIKTREPGGTWARERRTPRHPRKTCWHTLPCPSTSVNSVKTKAHLDCTLGHGFGSGCVALYTQACMFKEFSPQDLINCSLLIGKNIWQINYNKIILRFLVASLKHSDYGNRERKTSMYLFLIKKSNKKNI